MLYARYVLTIPLGPCSVTEVDHAANAAGVRHLARTNMCGRAQRAKQQQREFVDLHGHIVKTDIE